MEEGRQSVGGLLKANNFHYEQAGKKPIALIMDARVEPSGVVHLMS